MTLYRFVYWKIGLKKRNLGYFGDLSLNSRKSAQKSGNGARIGVAKDNLKNNVLLLNPYFLAFCNRINSASSNTTPKLELSLRRCIKNKIKKMKKTKYKKSGHKVGHTSVVSSIPVRRTIRRKAILRREWPFSYTFSTMFQDYKRQQRH